MRVFTVCNWSASCLSMLCGVSGGVRVLRLTNSYGHMETGPRFKVSSERLEKPRSNSRPLD